MVLFSKWKPRIFYIWFATIFLVVGLAAVPAEALSTEEVVSLTNQSRTTESLPRLSPQAELTRSAEAKLAHMQEHNYWDHYAPDGSTPWDFMRSTDYSYSIAGENLARGFSSATAMQQAWMNSPEHRANIMRAGYQDIGVAVGPSQRHNGDELLLVVVHFGIPRDEKGLLDESAAVEAEAEAFPGRLIQAVSRWLQSPQWLSDSSRYFTRSAHGTSAVLGF